jgi:hypothetical protein
MTPSVKILSALVLGFAFASTCQAGRGPGGGGHGHPGGRPVIHNGPARHAGPGHFGGSGKVVKGKVKVGVGVGKVGRLHNHKDLRFYRSFSVRRFDRRGHRWVYWNPAYRYWYAWSPTQEVFVPTEVDEAIADADVVLADDADGESDE